MRGQGRLGNRGWAILRRCAVLVVAAGIAGSALAQGSQFFRIGTGSTGGTYFPIGAILASAISNPPGSRECERGGSCGVPGLIAVAQSTTGSVENVRAIGSGLLESALSQADVAFWAYHGRHTFAETGPIKNLRAIANGRDEPVPATIEDPVVLDELRPLLRPVPPRSQSESS